MKDKVLTELIWLVAILGCAFLLTFLIGRSRGGFDIQLHDTYFVVAQGALNMGLFAGLVFFVYMIKEGVVMYSRVFPNWILIVSALIMVVISFWVQALLRQIETGLTTYPPKPLNQPPWLSGLAATTKIFRIVAVAGSVLLIVRNVLLFKRRFG